MKYQITRVFVLLIFILLVGSIQAQEEAQGFVNNSVLDSKVTMYLVGGIVLALVAFTLSVLFRLLDSMIRIKELDRDKSSESALQVLQKPTATVPMLQSIYQKITQAVPVAREKDILLDHDYDGIKELDNLLPPWWLGLFYGSIIFSIVYMGYYHFRDGALSSSEEWEVEMAEAREDVNRYLATKADVVDENTVTLLTEEDDLTAGQVTYEALCATCHLQNGAGLVGPNLTDKYWVHGGGIKDLFRTVKYGVPEKGMISWQSQLRPAQIQEVSSYILQSLQGTDPPNPKAPEGELYEGESN